MLTNKQRGSVENITSLGYALQVEKQSTNVSYCYDRQMPDLKQANQE